MHTSKKLMVVDDDQISNFLTEALVKEIDESVTIKFCENGEEALVEVKNCLKDEVSCPDLILLDVNMPVMNGFDFLTQLTEISQQNIPVIMLTASIHPKEFEMARKKFGVVDYLEKPLSHEKLSEIISKNF
jgi:CheY-like chemotaxis protein